MTLIEFRTVYTYENFKFSKRRLKKKSLVNHPRSQSNVGHLNYFIRDQHRRPLGLNLNQCGRIPAVLY